ncbi:MAG: hypothetical protein RL095_3267 [Verrucomicrobiota bacterium]|jgi:uncharacterized protein HemY
MDATSKYQQRWQQARRRKLLGWGTAAALIGLAFLVIALSEGALHAFYIFVGCAGATAFCLSARISEAYASLGVDLLVPCSTHFRGGEATETPLFDTLDALVKQGRLEEAWKLGQDNLRRFPDDPGLWERLIVMAVKHLRDRSLGETVLISAWERLAGPQRQGLLKIFLGHAGIEECPAHLQVQLSRAAAETDARRAYEGSWGGLFRRNGLRLVLAAITSAMTHACARHAWDSSSQGLLILLLVLQCLFAILSIWLILGPIRDLARHKVSAAAAPLGPWIVSKLRHGQVSPLLAQARHEMQQGRPMEGLQLAIQNARRLPQHEEAWMLAIEAAAASGRREIIEEVLAEAARLKVRPFLYDGIERIAAAKLRHLEEAARPQTGAIEVKIASHPNPGRSVQPRAPAAAPEPEALTAPLAMPSLKRRDDREERRIGFWQSLRCSPHWLWISFAIKLPFCLALAALGLLIGVLTGMIFIAIPFFIPLARIVVSLAVDLMPDLYGTGRREEGPCPLIGPVESRRFRGDPEGALTEARVLCGSHPQVLATWLLAVRIALIDLKRPEAAKEIVAEGLRRIEVPAERLRLQRYCQALGGGGGESLDPELERQAESERRRSELMKLISGLVWRLPCASFLAFLAWPQFAGSDLRKSLGILLITGAVMIMAPLLRPLFVTVLEFAFMPIHAFFRRVLRHGEMRPLIASAVKLRQERRYQEAFGRFAELSRQFPRDEEIWSHLLEIALVELKDRELAQGVLQKGLKKLPRKHRAAFHRLYERHHQDWERSKQAPAAPGIQTGKSQA